MDHNFFAALRPARCGGSLREEKIKKCVQPLKYIFLDCFIKNVTLKKNKRLTFRRLKKILW
jgi:hypothetical protein